ncbi:MAG: AAA family ATPase [Thermoleophilaceae bacterium]|nr:AAA family ATPase [Thermoleophilaceae bacterium]
MAPCPSCGKDNADDARFCSACGARLAVETPAREQRKTVTVVFCDLVGSTSLGEHLDSESLKRVMASYFAAMRSALERHGGTVEKFIGDAVVAVFGVPTLREDDALRAVRAAAEMRTALATLNEELWRRWGVELRTRTGVNTGEVVASDPSRGESFVVGDAVNVAARLEQSAPVGEILLGATTYRLVRDEVTARQVAPLALKGKAEKVHAVQLLEAAPGGRAAARRLDSPLVGREPELGQLEEAFERVCEARRCELLPVVGAAGVGKSRLVREFVGRVGSSATVLEGRCLPYGEGITFWPLSEVVKEGAGIREGESREEAQAKIASLLPGDLESAGVATRIAAAIGLAATVSTPEETFWAARQLFESLAARLPLLIVFDDVHWAEPTFLDLVEYLGEHVRDRSLLVLLLARPELREARPKLAQTNGFRPVVLKPLAEGDSERLILQLLGEASLATEVSQRITTAAQGNPLFVEELLRMLVDQGLLRRTKGNWDGDPKLSEIPIPPTIQALLGARLDRLGEGERAVIEAAAVVGQEFWPAAAAELTPHLSATDVDIHLTALSGKELIHRGGVSFANEGAYRFSHILVRDAAYAGLLKEARAELHERFATWLEEKSGARHYEYEEILGYHLEQAFLYRQQLAPLDDSGRALARRASGRLRAAAERALARGDMPAATNLLERAAALLMTGDPRRRELELQLGLALCELGDIARAEGVLAETAAAAAAGGDRALELRCLLERSYWRLATGLDASIGDVRRVAEQAIPALEAVGDEAGLARAWGHLAFVQSAACSWAETAKSLERGLEHARRAADGQQETELLWQLTGALHYGPQPVEEGIRRFHAALHHDVQSAGRSGMHVGVTTRAAVEATGLAGLEAMRGNADEARMLVGRAKAILEELGQRLKLAELGQLAGWVELLCGAPAAAEAELRRSYEALEEMGEQGYLSTTAGLLSEAVLEQGRYAEAEQLSRAAELSSAGDDVVSHVLWRGTRARALALRGELEPAESLARAAVRLAGQSDDLNLHADRLMDLADVLRVGGRIGEAEDAVSEAVALYEAKGNLASARKAHIAR